jgi:hypothetical protein
MWVQLLNSMSNYVILNGGFSVPFANGGNGWYYLSVGGNATVLASAPGYNSMYFNTDNYSAMYVWLTATTPPTTMNCWS